MAIATPADGAVYAQGSAVAGELRLQRSVAGSPDRIMHCPVPAGNAIDTAKLGLHAFTVRASDAAGMTAGATVQ